MYVNDLPGNFSGVDFIEILSPTIIDKKQSDLNNDGIWILFKTLFNDNLMTFSCQKLSLNVLKTFSDLL